jgi:hypothetical protein
MTIFKVLWERFVGGMMIFKVRCCARFVGETAIFKVRCAMFVDEMTIFEVR